jgi:CO/xanthine dehydrogenase Mo-binding subunit
MNKMSNSLLGIRAGRRSVLKGLGALVVSFGVPVGLVTPAHAAAFPDVPSDQLDSWLAIAQDGSVTVYTGRIDMGTGVQTVYTQIVADELDVPLNAVKVILGTTDRTPEQGKSTASNSVMLNSPPLSHAAAEARLTLLEMASAKLGVPLEKLEVVDGVISEAGGSGAGISYAELIGGQRFNVVLTVEGEGVRKMVKGRALPKDPKLVGKSIPRVDIPDMVTGKYTYVHDIVIDGMLHGAVVLPPRIGAKLVSVDGFATDMPGVQVVTKGDFVAVVAETEWQAVQAQKALRVTWEGGGIPGYVDYYDNLLKTPIREDKVELEEGNVADALAAAAHVVEGTYLTPVNSHGMMGPSCAVAEFKDGNLTIWSGTQWPDATRRDTAAMIGLPVENVRLIWHKSAGSYGRLGTDDAAADAALLSMELGRPVRVQWQRADEHAWAPAHAGAVAKVKAGVDAEGNITGWEYDMWTPSHSTAERGNMLAWRLIGSHPGHPRLSGGASGPNYAVPNLKVTSHYTEEVLRSIYMRTVAGIQNSFVHESVMDDLAVAAGIDPVEFRLRHLADERDRAVLQAAAELAGWVPGAQKTENGNIVSGRGVAFDSSSAKVATIADVDVNRRNGRVYVRRLFVGFDVGRIYNPDGLRAQIEGGTLMGVSRALMEDLRFDGASITATDWVGYPVMRFSDVPETLEIVMLDNENPPGGAGEPPTVTPAAAIGNAIFAATGVRIHELPFSRDKVKAALS